MNEYESGLILDQFSTNQTPRRFQVTDERELP
jgi:hypothetical protein